MKNVILQFSRLPCSFGKGGGSTSGPGHDKGGSGDSMLST